MKQFHDVKRGFLVEHQSWQLCRTIIGEQVPTSQMNER